MESSTWNNNVVGEISKWINPDIADPFSRRAAENALIEELQWASHLSLGAVVLPCPQLERSHNYINIINRQLCAQHYNVGVWIRCPLATEESLLNPEDVSADPWTAWNKLWTMCKHHSNLGVLLELSESLPDSSTIDKWYGEPVKALEIPTSVFLTNSKGYPVLTKPHQEVIIGMYKKNAQLIVSGRPRHILGLNPYFLYLQHLINRIPGQTMKDEFEAPFYDYLQSPLQPLGDHLESQMYETFEKDPVKYAKYEEAIARALADTPEEKTSVVMVVGAGRGPLVRATLRAAETSNRQVRVFAVEKNPNAVITLRNMRSMLGWGDTVTVIHTDMRFWNPPELADILVSELLGSWGDNELSPECLDGAERLLKPDGGISIPYEYTSFLAPITASKLWNGAKAFKEAKYMETMYVCKLHCFSNFAPVQPCFTFAHPSWNKVIDNESGREKFALSQKGHTVPQKITTDTGTRINNDRCRTLSFRATMDGTLHGFAGYFEAKLYKDIMISINPETFSTGMFSWFPMYIPIQLPQQVRKGDLIRTTFWRQSTSTKVWYEWAVDSPHCTCIHNANGEASPINLTTN
mmetsp:Transcript_14028/g.22912  ORF Transcript_14028/g.22912 Transcript_14028/m.22912 type:complete len:579 (-) Transcript_14028:1110-2846(-)